MAQVKLLEETKCEIVLVAEDDHKLQEAVASVSQERKIEIHQFPTLISLLDGTKAPHYPFLHSLDEVRHNDYVVIHTSGSTGMSVFA